MAEYTREVTAIANALTAIAKELKAANEREKERDRQRSIERQRR